MPRGTSEGGGIPAPSTSNVVSQGWLINTIHNTQVLQAIPNPDSKQIQTFSIPRNEYTQITDTDKWQMTSWPVITNIHKCDNIIIPFTVPFLPRCMQCRRGLAMRILSVCLSICPSHEQLCENCQEQSCKAFIGLTIGAKMIGGGRPLLPEILSQSGRAGAKFEQ